MQWQTASQHGRQDSWRAGHTTLVKVVLSVIPIHVSIAEEIAPAVYKAIGKIRVQVGMVVVVWRLGPR
jgi:hypothetical protein